MLKIKKTISRRTSLPGGDSFITSTQIEFEATDYREIEQKNKEIRKLIIAEARKDTLEFFKDSNSNDKEK